MTISVDVAAPLDVLYLRQDLPRNFLFDATIGRIWPEVSHAAEKHSEFALSGRCKLS
jgi:hypothetical protein